MKDIKEILEFIYTGEINFEVTRLPGIIHAANLLQIKYRLDRSSSAQQEIFGSSSDKQDDDCFQDQTSEKLMGVSESNAHEFSEQNHVDLSDHKLNEIYTMRSNKL